MRLYLSVILVLFVCSGLNAQHLPASASDTASVQNFKDWFARGTIHGHFRNYLMATFNSGDLNDYVTNATGGALAFRTAEYKGLSIGVKGIFTFNTFDNDLLRIDDSNGKFAKWETELYDFTRPEEKKDLDRLEELFVQYKFGRSSIAYGKLDINKGPFLKRRDGRMKPFVYHGLWSELHLSKLSELNIGWIHGVSPRGITEWFSINEAIGILNNGRDCHGEPSHYHDTSNSKGMGVVDYNLDLKNGLKVQIADYWLHRIMNTIWVQTEYSIGSYMLGLQWVSQQASNHQGDLEVNQRYFDKAYNNHTLAFRLGWSSGDFSWNVNYLQGIDEGRFLFPKELGRDNFYVSLPRMWMDGLGESRATSINLAWHPDRLDIRTSFAYVSPQVKDNYISNKYGLNAFMQCNLQVDYTFTDIMEGVRISFLYVARPVYDKDGLEEGDAFYKYDLHHFNFITNINF